MSAPMPLRVAGYQRTPHADLLNLLREVGVEARGEVRLPAVSPRSRSGYFRADVGIYRRGVVIAVVECKRRTRELGGRQRENYDGCGLPYIVAGYDNLDAAVEWCERVYDGGCP